MPRTAPAEQHRERLQGDRHRAADLECGEEGADGDEGGEGRDQGDVGAGATWRGAWAWIPSSHLNGGQLNGVQVRVTRERRQCGLTGRTKGGRAPPPRRHRRAGRAGARRLRARRADHAPARLRARPAAQRPLPPLPEQAGPARRGRRRGAGPRPAPRADGRGTTCSSRPATSCATRCSPTATAPTWCRRSTPSGWARRRRPTSSRRSSPTAGFTDPLVGVGARTLLHFVFGHTFEEQTALQAESAGAIDGPPAATGRPTSTLGLGLVLDGLAAHAPAGRRVRG